MKWLCIFIMLGVSMGAQAKDTTSEKAIFAGGCFWCIEAELQELDGVDSVISGYTGGHIPNPTYEMISKGDTGHYEAVEVTYNPQKISYKKLLDAFWSNIDPTDDGGQFYDRGQQYQTAVFYTTPEQKLLAEASKLNAQAVLESPVATKILPAATFFPAEKHHQDYYKTNPLRYNAYKHGSGRESTLNQVWGKTRPNEKTTDTPQ